MLGPMTKSFTEFYMETRNTVDRESSVTGRGTGPPVNGSKRRERKELTNTGIGMMYNPNNRKGV